MSYTGRVAWQPGRRSAVAITLFDSVDSFGRSLNGSLANLGTDFYVIRNPFSGDIGGCAFVSEASGGACYGDALSAIRTARAQSFVMLSQVPPRRSIIASASC